MPSDVLGTAVVGFSGCSAMLNDDRQRNELSQLKLLLLIPSESRERLLMNAPRRFVRWYQLR